MSTLVTPYVSVVVPAYNEARRLPATLASISAYLEAQPYVSELIIADDGSSDNTAALVEQFALKHPNVQLLRLDHRGKGYAVRRGILSARGDYILFSDADLAVPIDEWPKLETPLKLGADVAIGSREGLGARREGEPFYRHVMGRVFNLIVRTIAIGGIQDTQCGFKAFRRQAAHDIFRRSLLYGDDAPIVRGAAVTAFDVEVLYLAVRCGYKIREIPLPWHYGSETKVDPLRDSYRNLRDVLRVRYFALTGRYRKQVPHNQATHTSQEVRKS